MPESLLAAWVRHGAYEQPVGVPSAHLPHPLTPEGREQSRQGARQMLEVVAHEGWTLDNTLDCSVLLRAFQTAETFASVFEEELGRPFRIAPHADLAERSVGAAANLTLDAIEGVLAADPRFEPPPLGWKLDSTYRLPFIGAESLLEAGSRVARCVQRRLADLAASVHDSATPRVRVFVGHGGAFRHAALHLGVLTAEEVPRLSMGYAQAVYLGWEAPAFRHVAGAWKRRPVVGAPTPAETDG